MQSNKICDQENHSRIRFKNDDSFNFYSIGNSYFFIYMFLTSFNLLRTVSLTLFNLLRTSPLIVILKILPSRKIIKFSVMSLDFKKSFTLIYFHIFNGNVKIRTHNHKNNLLSEYVETTFTKYLM